MKKATILALALIMPVVAALASPVDKEAAKAKATAFLQQKAAATSGRHHAPQQLELVSAQKDNAPYYVFNNANGQGFAIVAGDDTADSPILGYSTEGSFDENNIPDALRAALSDYAKVVEFAQQNGLSMNRAPRKVTRDNIAPFLVNANNQLLQWNQNGVYASACPSDGTATGHCSTGCMAVTVAMIVAHYQYPVGLPGHTNGSYRSEYHEYDYTQFQGTYSSATGEMPQFMFHIANLLDTSFKADGSSATESRFLPTMTNYLDYNKNMKSIMRDSYSAEEWENIIYNELAARRPVNFLGEHPDLGGHSYICDGYRSSDGFFHMIWGWGTNCVGYFDMNVLNPFVAYFGNWGSMGYTVPPGGFTSGLKAVIGIQPEELEGNTIQLLTTEDIIKEGTSSVRATIRNWDDRTFRGQISWAILNDDESFTQLANATVQNISGSTGSYYANIFNTLNIVNLNLGDGYYKIVPICKTNDDGAEWMLCEGYKQKFVEIDIVDGKTTIIPHPVKNVTAEVLTYKGSTGTQYMELLLKLQNHGDDVYGYLTLSGTREDNVKVYGSKIDIAVKAGESQLLSVFLDNGSGTSYGYSGHTYDVTVQYMQNSIGTFTVDPNAYEPSSYYITYQGVEFDDYEYVDGNAYLYNTTLKGDVLINCSSSSKYYAPVRFILKDENMNKIYEKTMMYNFDKSETKRYPLEVTGLQAGKKYYLSADLIKLNRSSSTYSETVVKNYFTDFPINVIVGVPYYTENGTLDRMVITGDEQVNLPANTAAVDFRTFSPEQVNLGSVTNENCVYVFEAGATVPAELDGKNVVVGNTAEVLNLVEGKPVAFPVAFTATEATYTRQMTDDNWNTIVIPFAATVKVEGEDADIDWFRRGEPNGRKFWLYKFNGSDAASVYFDGETTKVMTPNTPYLISVPGGQWGEEYNLSDKMLVFHGQNVGISTEKPEIITNFYSFKGTYTPVNTNGGYKLNEDGDFFELQTADVNEAPFHAFFMGSESSNNSKRALTLSLGDVPTLIMNLEDGQLTTGSDKVYDLQGRRVQNAQKGIYIQNGKKVVVK